MSENSFSVLLGPDPWPELVDAVKSSGCTMVTSFDEADAVVWFGRDPDELVGRLPDGLRWLQVPDAGIEKWMRPEFTGQSFTLTCSSGIYGGQVAEHTLSLLLALFHGLGVFARDTSWTPRVGAVHLIRGSSVLILGGGGIGAALAPLVTCLGASATVVTRSGRAIEGATSSASMDRLFDLLPTADAVVVCLPVTEETRGLVDRDFLDRMKPSAFLVNVARGDLVDTEALLAALEEGSIAGAGLDVTDPEPLPPLHPLFSHPHALVTPHAANPQELKKASFTELVRENCRCFRDGRELSGVVDVNRGY